MPAIRFQYLLPAMAMMLGWGLRGFIGGGPFGAMIPGAMVMLTLCLLHRRRDTAMLAAFGAIGVGFGGEMTYGQTVGFIVRAETFWWGFLGLALKGAIWGALAGAVIGLGVTPLPRLVSGAAVVLVSATALGWKFINQPKLIYFSNLADRPRAEIWAGFALAAAALVAYLKWQGKAQPAARFALAGFVGGGIGFGLGGAIQGLGRIFTPSLQLHWWKYMEFFFGFSFGWALAWAMARTPAPEDESPEKNQPAWLELLAAAAITGALLWTYRHLPLRYGYLVAGVVVLVLLTRLRWLAPHVAYSVTFTAVTFDLAKYWSRETSRGAPEPAYMLAIAASIGFAYLVCRWNANPLRMLDLLMWACVVDATAKFAMHPSGIANLVDHVAIGFVLMAAAVSWMARSALVPANAESGGIG